MSQQNKQKIFTWHVKTVLKRINLSSLAIFLSFFFLILALMLLLKQKKKSVLYECCFCVHRNSFWPNGVLAEPRTPRDEATKMRTRVLCKAKMLGSVPGKFKIT